jgi:diphthine methyl ester acylhydrolase
MEDEGEEIKSFQSMLLDLPPSCIEFCPRYPSFFLVGTYYLEANEVTSQESEKDDGGDEAVAEARQPQSKSGSILVFELRDGQA